MGIFAENINKKITVRNYTIIILSVLLCACRGHVTKEQEQSGYATPEFGSEQSVAVADSVVIAEQFKTYNWKVGDGRLAVQDMSNKDILKVYSWPGGERIMSGVNLGQGPDEFVAVNGGDAADDRHFLLYDIMKRSAMLFDFSGDSIRNPEPLDLLADADGRTNPYTYITQVNDSLYLMKMDSFDKSNWQLANLKSGELKWEHDNPLRNPELAYSPYDFIQNVEGETMSAVYRYINLVELYDFSEAEGLKLSKCFGDNKDQSEIPDHDWVNYYLAAFARGGKLYCLRSADGGEEGNVVEVYDLAKREPLKRIVLDRAVTDLRSDPQGRLVGYAPNEETSVFYIWNVK